MIRLLFDNDNSTGPVPLGPAPWFRVGGNFIRLGPHNSIGGTYRQHHWEVAAHYFTRFDCKDRAFLHFEDCAGGASESFGPFTEFYAADGIIHADGELFAKFVEESQLWHCYPTENFWPILVIQPAP